MVLQAIPAYIAKQADGVTDFQHSIETLRTFNKALFDRTGVFRFGDFFIQPTGSGMGVSIGGGHAHLLGPHSSLQGGYFVWSNSADTLTLGAPSGSTRYDSILLRVADNQYGTITGAPRAYLEVVPGAAGAGGPRADSYFQSGGGSYQPGAWFRLCDIRVDPGDTTVSNAKITTNFQYVGMPGGTTLCTSSTRPAVPNLGDKIYETDTGLEYMWTLNNWIYQGNYRNTNNLAASASTVTFNNIPRNIRHLRVSMTMKSDAGNGLTFMTVNSDSSANYRYQNWNSFTVGTDNNSSVTSSNLVFGVIVNTVYTTATIDIIGWNSPHSNYLTMQGQSGYISNTTGGSNNQYFNGAYTASGNNYTSLTIGNTAGTFAVGSQFTIHGLA